MHGERVVAPPDLPDPRSCGFRTLALAEPAGQIADFALSQEDGSRIHVHQHANGRRVVHRDKYDPERGLASAVLHLATETTFGKIALVGLIVAIPVGIGIALTRDE